MVSTKALLENHCSLDIIYFKPMESNETTPTKSWAHSPIVKRKDEAAHGTYHTKDTILSIYDEMAEAIRTGKPYQTRLDPPPVPPTDEHGNFLPLPEWKPGQPKPPRWSSHIHPLKADGT
jgi:hypothetical protein